MKVKKKSDSRWFTCFGNKVFEKGIHKWRVTDVEYPSGDLTGIIFGVCETSAK